MEWLKNLSRAIKYIEANLDKTVSTEEAARIACCSTYYFQRMFSYVAEIPLSEYIRRRRMTQAAVSIFFSVRIAAGFTGMLLIVLMVFLSAFFMAGLAYAISLTLPNEVIYETVMNAIVLPMFFLSTALFPAESLTGALKVAVNLNPFTHVIHVLRSLLLQGHIEINTLLRVILLLVVMCGLSFYWAYRRLKKETSL